ncbi:GH39 family glycosyl hydrolase [Paenibacillus silvisoli]|uniref:GH39 family glycosyl hydrolase n=1 Tax=Paenibacillus silvisoli TaxID=3110539 RepID=UPI002803B7F4|nr:glycosyl hydrolase [Paenibacillus silvisoli]
MNYKDMTSIKTDIVAIDLAQKSGPYEWWRHTIGHGGINSKPLPERVIQGSRAFKPRLLRTFIQEFFNVYPEHGRFDWSKLDPYMDALHQTGANVVAAITIKPPVLYPEINHSIWRPNNIEEWQQVIYELVNRYSVEKQIVTYWEIGNETDIGEHGGSPYLIQDVVDYMEFYRFTIEPIRKAFPSAKIGGPAIANFKDKLLFDFIDECHRTQTQLDFISWHLYDDDPERHKSNVISAKRHLAQFGDNQPEMLVTEWSKSFDRVSYEELAHQPRRAAATAASIMAMMEAGLDWSFYYHVWDQSFNPKEFEAFYKELPIMIEHWNEGPHRFGLFGVEGEVRPQYFVYTMLSQMDGEQIKAESTNLDLRVNAVTRDDQTAVLISNFNVIQSADTIAITKFQNLTAGPKQLQIYRIDNHRSWSTENLELVPVESRDVDLIDHYPFRLQTLCPADSVTLIILKNL